MVVRPRVLHVINGLEAGGAEALLYRLATRDSPFEQQIVSLVEPGHYSSLLAQHGIKVTHLNLASPSRGPWLIWKLRQLIKESQADVVQSWMYASNLVAGIAAKWLGVPVVWGIHSSSLNDLSLTSRMAARLSALISKRFPAKIISCSIRSAEIHQRFGYAPSKLTVIPNGYDEQFFLPDERRRTAARLSVRLDPDTFLVGCIARWNLRKDVPNLLRALEIVALHEKPMHCILVGRDLDRSNAELVEQIAKIGDRVTITALGHRSDIGDLARAMDLHVLPSATEAFPNVVGETMLCGTPNVVTDVGDAALMVGNTGWVVPPHNPDKLAGAILAAHAEWKQQPVKWKQRRADAREAIAGRFTFVKMANAYESVWFDVIASAGAR